MQLDHVITIAIGRNRNDNGEPLSHNDWEDFKRAVRIEASMHGLVVAEGELAGIGSDGDNDGVAEDSYIVSVVLAELEFTSTRTLAESLRLTIAPILMEYHQTSAAFVNDPQHEPVFNTPNGYRPENN